MSQLMDPQPSNKLVRTAVVLALLGLMGLLVFLWRGFGPWSVGVGIFLGAPLLIVAVGLYVTAVVRDLHQRRIL